MFWGTEQITWRGVNIIINPGEIHGYYVYFLGDYATEEVDFIISLCLDSSVFVDVGANIGLMTLAIARACPNVHVYAFEPDPLIISRLKQNLNLNSDLAPRITVIQAAVCDIDGYVSFQSTADTVNTGTGHIVKYNQADALPLSLASVRLDTYFIDIPLESMVVKIDVEGAELEVLQGMENLFTVPNSQDIVLEVHAFYIDREARTNFKSHVEQILTRAGFDLFLLDGSPAPHSHLWSDRIHIHARLPRNH